jgi:hypothetical protein
MRKLYVIALLLPFVFSCNSDGNGLYGPPDAFEWDFDLGVFNGDVDMYIDGVYDSTYESNTMSIASSWQITNPTIGNPWEMIPFAPNCSSSNFVVFNEFSNGWTGFANSCGILDGEVFTIFNIAGYPIFDDSESPSIIFWAETYGGGTFDGNEIHIEFYEVFRNIDMDEIVSIKMWTGTLTKVYN